MQYALLKEKLLGLFEPQILKALPEEWGFTGEAERDIRRVAYATSLTPEVIEGAAAADAGLLLTHHDAWPFLYGLRDRCMALLASHGITHAFFHAPLDDASFGTSAALADAMGLRNQVRAMPYMEVCRCGILGEVEPEPFDVFAARLSAILGEPVRALRNHEGPVRRVAVVAGGGNLTTEMQVAAEAGCDTYITGEYALYSELYARFTGMHLLVGSHTNTELPGVRSLAGLLARDTDLKLVHIPEPND